MKGNGSMKDAQKRKADPRPSINVCNGPDADAPFAIRFIGVDVRAFAEYYRSGLFTQHLEKALAEALSSA